MILPLEIILHVHKLSDIDTRRKLEYAFNLSKIRYKIKLPKFLDTLIFRKVKNLYFNSESSIYYINLPMKSMYSKKNLIISKSCIYNYYYVTVTNH